jgi:hypothetical protein
MAIEIALKIENATPTIVEPLQDPDFRPMPLAPDPLKVPEPAPAPVKVPAVPATPVKEPVPA